MSNDFKGGSPWLWFLLFVFAPNIAARLLIKAGAPSPAYYLWVFVAATIAMTGVALLGATSSKHRAMLQGLQFALASLALLLIGGMIMGAAGSTPNVKAFVVGGLITSVLALLWYKVGEKKRGLADVEDVSFVSDDPYFAQASDEDLIDLRAQRGFSDQ